MKTLILAVCMMAATCAAQTNAVKSSPSVPTFNHPDYVKATNDLAAYVAQDKEITRKSDEVSRRMNERRNLIMPPDQNDKTIMGTLSSERARVRKEILKLRQQEFTLRTEYGLDDPKKVKAHTPDQSSSPSRNR
jgi:vancomycin resistance protein YoaR